MSSVSSLNSLLASSTSSSSSANSSINLSSILSAATGASSVGIDVSSAVDAAIYAARAPERQWQAQQTTLQAQSTAITSIQTAITTLTTDLSALNDSQGAIAANAVTSSNASEVSATASPNATAGNHVVSVQNLATAASWYSSPLSSGQASPGSSALQITMTNGTQANFQLGSNGSNSLSALAATINAAGLGVSASVISDTSGSRLALVGQSTGGANGFSVSEVATPASTWTSAQVASPSTPVASGNYTLSDGTTSASFTVPGGSSLADVANQINSLGLNLTASVTTSSSGAALSIQASGGNAVTMSADPALSLTQSSTAEDASLTVDGIPVTSASSTVSGAIQGVTLNLQGTTAGSSVSLNVAPDSSKITSLLSQFVSDYNNAVNLVNSQFTLTSGTSSQGVLGSDPTIRSLQSTLLSLTAYHTTASDGSGSSLASLGISANDDGSMSLDTTKLNTTLQQNPQSLKNFVQGSALNGFASSASKQLKLFADPASGVLNVDLKNLAQQYNNLQTNISDFESGYIASQTTVLTNMYSKAEIALQQLPAQLKALQAQLSNGSGS